MFTYQATSLQLYSESKRVKLYRGASLKINDNRQSMTDKPSLVERCGNTVKRLGASHRICRTKARKNGGKPVYRDWERKMNDAQLAVKNWDRKSSRPAAFAIREIAGFNKYWGIFECEDGSKFFWFGSTNTIAEEK